MSPRLRPAIVFGLGFVCALADAVGPVSHYDEGITAYPATLVQQGSVPYRDFLTLYGPAVFYLYAAWFTIFGASLATERALSCLIAASLALAIHLASGSVVNALFFALWMRLQPGVANPPAVACALFACRLLECGRPGAAGAIAGLTALFRQDIGAGTLLVQLLWLSVQKQPARSYLAGFAALTLPVALALLAAVPFSLLWHDLVAFPLGGYRDVRSLPYGFGVNGPIDGAAFLLPFAVLAHSRFRSLYAWLGLALFGQMSVRADAWHLLPVMSCIAVLLPRRSWIAMLAGLALVAPVHDKLNTLFSRPSRLTVPRGHGLPAPPEYDACLHYVMEQVPRGEAIYAGNKRHDRIHTGDVMFYFLAERNAATRHFYLHPGITTRLDIQREIVEDLEHVRPRLIVLWDEPESPEPNDARLSSGVTLLDGYIRANYALDRPFGTREVWRRLSAPTSLAPPGSGGSDRARAGSPRS